MEHHLVPLRLPAAERGERQQLLAALYAHMRDEAGLPLINELGREGGLYADARFVCGSGAPDAQLLVLGDVPSATDAQTGVAFSGDDGHIVRDAVHKWFGDSVFFMHLVSVRPLQAVYADDSAGSTQRDDNNSSSSNDNTNNNNNNNNYGAVPSAAARDPTFEEVCAYAGYALQQILIVRPRVVLALGPLAATLVRRQFAPDRLVDVRAVAANMEQMQRARIETLDEALRVHEALRAERLGTLRGASAGAPYVFAQLGRAGMRRDSLARLRLEDRHGVLTVASCGFACRTLVCEAPHDYFRSARHGAGAGDATPTLALTLEWGTRLAGLARLQRLAPPPVFVLEPNHAPFAAPAAGYARLPRFDVLLARGAERAAAERACAGVFAVPPGPRAPTDTALAHYFANSTRPLLFQLIELAYDQRTNCFEAYGRTTTGWSVCARVQQPCFEFCARLLDWSWVTWLREPDAQKRADEVAWLADCIGACFERIVEATPHYVAAAERSGATAELALAQIRELEVSVVEARSQYYITDRCEPFVRVVYHNKAARAAAEEAVRAVLATVAWQRARRHSGVDVDADAAAAAGAAPRVELFELESDPVQQFCLATGVATGGWMCVQAPLALVPADGRHTYCDVEVLTTQADVCGVLPGGDAASAAAAPSFAAFALRHAVPAEDADDAAWTLAALPESWGALAPYHVCSMDIEALATEQDKFPEPATCPVLSICAVVKRFDQRAGRAAQREDIVDERRKPRQSGCVDYDAAVVFALKSCGALAPRTYEPASHGDGVHNGVPGVRALWRAEHARYCAAVGAPPACIAALADESALDSRFLLAHFAQAALDDAAAPEAERVAGRALLGSRALARYRLGIVDGRVERTPWRRIGLLLPSVLADVVRCRCGCARAGHTHTLRFEQALARLAALDAGPGHAQRSGDAMDVDGGGAGHAQRGGAGLVQPALTRAERHLLLFLRARYDAAFAWLCEDEARLFAATRPRTPWCSDDDWQAPAEPVFAVDVKEEARWSWRPIADELCATQPALAEPHNRRLTWRLAGRVLPELLAETACACGCASASTSAGAGAGAGADQPVERARRHVARFLRRHLPATLAQPNTAPRSTTTTTTTTTAVTSTGAEPLLHATADVLGGELAAALGGAVWRAPVTTAGGDALAAIDWDEALEALAAATPGLVELVGYDHGGGRAADDEPWAGVRFGDALSTWNEPCFDWMRLHGPALVARLARLHPEAHDHRHLVFEPARLLRALLQRVAPPPGYVMDEVERARDERHYALAEAARRTRWYAFRPVPTVHQFETEEELLEAWAHFSVDDDADVVTGYNIKKFDYPFLLERARVLGVAPLRFNGVYQLGRVRGRQSEVTHKMFESRAFGQRELVDVTMAGRVVLDMYDYCAREKKWPSYKLGYASTKMLGDTKDDVPHTVIYSLFMHDRERLHRYCLKDAELCMRMLVVDNVIEFALELVRLISALPLSALYVRGQQARVVSLHLRHLRKLAAQPRAPASNAGSSQHGGVRYLLPTQRGAQPARGSMPAQPAERAGVSVAPDAERLRAAAVLRYAAGAAAGGGEEDMVPDDARPQAPDMVAALEARARAFEARYARVCREPERAGDYVHAEEQAEVTCDTSVDELVAGEAEALRDEDAAYERAFGDGGDDDDDDDDGAGPALRGGGADLPQNRDGAEQHGGSDGPHGAASSVTLGPAAAAVVAAAVAAGVDRECVGQSFVLLPAVAKAVLSKAAPAAAAAATTPASAKRKRDDAAPGHDAMTAAMMAASAAGAFKKKKKASTVSYEGAFVFDPVRGLCLTVTEVDVTGARRKVGVIVCLDFNCKCSVVVRVVQAHMRPQLSVSICCWGTLRTLTWRTIAPEN